MQEFPIGYEYVDGAIIAPDLAGREVPVPPAWVLDWASVPDKAKYACLAKELDDWYGGHRGALVEYVKGWVQHVRYGYGLLIAGPTLRKLRTWMAAAVINEIVMRFGPRMGLSCAWFSAPRGLPNVIDARAVRPDEYLAIKNRCLNAKLLLVEGLDAVSRRRDAEWFLEMVYTHRYDYRLPTITTMTVDATNWANVEKLLGRFLTFPLKESIATTIHC